MANPIRPLEVSAQNFLNGATAASDRYVYGVNNPKRNWKTATEGAADRHSAAMTKAIAAKSFLKGVQKVSQADYQTATATKGATRWPEGIATSLDKWKKGFGPYHAALGNETLPPRGARRSQENKNRMLANVKTMEDTYDALHK